MTTIENKATILENRHTSHVDAHEPLRLCVLEGTAYVTLEGDSRDYIIRRGESLNVNNPGLVVIQGLPDVSYQVCA